MRKKNIYGTITLALKIYKSCGNQRKMFRQLKNKMVNFHFILLHLKNMFVNR